MPEQPRSVLLVDGFSLIHRGFHALPLLTGGGTYTNAVQGFFSMLFKAIADYRPDALCVMMDLRAPTFRHVMYDAYKAGRKPTPEELRPQFDVVREILRAMNVTICELEGYEADDLLGSAARLANEQGIHAYILTGDRDSLQLVGGDTQVILTKTGITESLLLSPDAVKAVYGFTPEQVTDMKGLMGDSSDNIPGVPGVGEKTALKLITEYGTLENVLAHADEVKGKLGERLRENRELAILSKDLGTIRRTAPLKLDFAACTLGGMIDALPTMRRYELNRLSTQLTQLFADNPNDVPPQTALAAAPAPQRVRSRDFKPTSPIADEPLLLPDFTAPQSVTTLTDAPSVAALAKQLCGESEPVALYAGESAVALAAADGRAWLCPIPMDMMSVGLYDDQTFAALEPLLARGGLLVHGAKALWTRLAKLKLPLPTIAHDTMIAAYLLECTQRSFDLAATLANERGDAPAEDAIKSRKPAPIEPPEQAARNAVDLQTLCRRQCKRLEYKSMLSLYRDMEAPLTRVLFDMEREGFGVDLAVLDELGAQFSAELERCRTEVVTLAGGEDFNLNSPKQLGDVLFTKLRLPSPKKPKNGVYSTAADVLEAIDHPLIEPLLRYRKLSKLQGTYIDGLRKLRDAAGRVHTTFDQTATVTGRISSLEPNLQNIPVRSDEGREIRKAFVAREGCVLLDADYSQIELRVLAHLSGDPAMQDAFNRGQDIHTRTASEVNGVPFEDVTPAMRRSAKAVNFGIVYGISGFGLARNIGVSKKEADAFIATYFERYPLVKRYMDDCVRLGYERGYTETLFGRRRDLFELRSPNRNLRSFGERAAMNTPVQGTAADIIKLAMAHVHEALQGFEAKLILQVHDELVIECPVAETEAVSGLLKRCMEGVIRLDVPLLADVNAGRSWYDAK